MKGNRIVFLDSGTVNYGDLSLKAFRKLGVFRDYFSTKPSQMRSRLHQARHVITNKCGFDRKLLSKLPSLQCIHVTATGVNNVDLKAAGDYGIAVTNVSGYSTESVLQFTIGFLLALAGNLTRYTEACRRGVWSRSPFFMSADFPIREIAGKTLGIVGYGTIGKRVAAVAKSFGMRVVVSQIPGRAYSKRERTRRSSLEQVLRKADFLTIHAPLTDLTRNLIHRGNIRKMKKGSFLINMARGGIVNEEALYRALKSGQLAGAACDVLTQEPPPKRHILLKAPNLLMTPHVAWASLEARTRVIREVVLNIQAFQAGKKRNRVV